jgi:hypothetical protein
VRLDKLNKLEDGFYNKEEADFNVAELLLIYEALNVYKADNTEIKTRYQGSDASITEVIRKVKAKGIQIEGEVSE